MARYVYGFGAGKADGSSGLRELLGGKGAELAEMSRLGVPVPPGFTVTTEAWRDYDRAGGTAPDGLREQVADGLRALEAITGRRFGDPSAPLLVSVRSGARVSMPGMMETVLNLGLNDATVEGLATLTGQPRFAWDCYRRFIGMYADVVLGLERAWFDGELEAVKARLRVRSDPEVPGHELQKLAEAYKDFVAERTGQPFPQDPVQQLERAVQAVFDSWHARRAVEYRRIHGISAEWGTAVTVMAMVFGNLGETSGTGVAFTRDPATGERRFYGEFLVNAQGEDVVAGIRTPEPIGEVERRLPAVWTELVTTAERLERHYRDVQDIEFTVEDGTLYLLQTRTAKRTAAAAVRTVVEMVREGLIDRDTALLRVDPRDLGQLLHPRFDPTDKARAVDRGRLLARGLPAAPGAAVGRVVFDADRAVEWARDGQKVILVRAETSPEDIAGMHAAEGILTSRGGLTSHAAVVARGMGKCCVVGAADVYVDQERRALQAGRVLVREGEVVSLDGATGDVLLDGVARIDPVMSGELQVFLRWADEARTLGVRANADTPADARKAREYGAEGIGLVRTEHMFFQEERIPIVRRMIMAGGAEQRDEALARLLPFQREDFIGIFRAMDGLPVTIRLLDPPLHEFLPRYADLLGEFTRLDALGVNPGRARQLERELAKVGALAEANPMLGHRGCRLGITFPEIYAMQVRAILEAACAVTREGVRAIPEIMVPLTGTVGEMRVTAEATRATAEAVLAETGVSVAYSVGTMIEVPRAALIADQIAAHAEFFSFGTNDLTQMTFGYSRDDVGKFLPQYLGQGLVPHDPFAVLDEEGVGELIRIGIERGRRARPGLKIGICGEHGGEPASVEFCGRVGMSYVSCSPFMLPIARLAAAQGTLRARRAGEGAPHA